VSWSGIAYIVESPVARGRALAASARGDSEAARAFFAEAMAEAERAGVSAVEDRIRRDAGGTDRVAPSKGAARPVEAALSFVCEGEYWTVRGEGVTLRLKDSRGMRMLAALAETPGRELHALDLAGLGGPEGSVDAGDAGEVLDRRARDAHRARVAELAREREEAEAQNDPGRVERVRAELEALGAELSRGVGLGGRARRAGRAAERARINVQRRLTEAIRRIEEADVRLGAYLRKAVRTGAFCSYHPERVEARSS
jgi:hypothetical protein